MKDANGQRFWQLANAGDWPAGDPRVEYDEDCRHLRLRDRRPRRSDRGAPLLAEAERLARLPARARDAFGTLAWWEGGVLRATGALAAAVPAPAPVVLWQPSSGTEVLDLALGVDDVLYLAVREAGLGGARRVGIRLLDRRERWRDPVAAWRTDFVPDKLAAHPGGGVWALDRAGRRLARLRGLPLRDFRRESLDEFGPADFRPVPEDPDPLRWEPVPAPDWARDVAGADGLETVVAMAASPTGELAVLTWRGSDQSWLHQRDGEGRWQAARPFDGDHRLFSLAWLAEGRIAALPAPRLEEGRTLPPREALVFSTRDRTERLLPSGDFHPLRGFSPEPWVQGVTLPPHYPVDGPGSAPLIALSGTRFESRGTAQGRVLDGGSGQPTWHRLNLEAVIPPGCGVVVALATTRDPDDPRPADESAWFEHHFGTTPATAVPGPSGEGRGYREPPRGVRMAKGSEIPGHAGLWVGDAADEVRGTQSGTFTVLIQRVGRRVRALRGRCLHVRVTLHGRGSATPRIYALRAWGSRFSYRDRYLPELYRESVSGRDAETEGTPTGADFLDRFLGLFESVLTPIEDQVAAAHGVTHPRSAPEGGLEWLASWLGEVFEAGFPADRRRAWIEAVPWLQRAHGTAAGLQLALEIATGGRIRRQVREPAGREIEAPVGGGVSGGEIVVVEDFRLRRTMATILGANLTETEDPLLPGLLVSANSRVGDTLILGEEERKEFLALFRRAFDDKPVERAREVEAVSRFYERLAHRVTILVHQEIEPRDLGLIRRVAQRMVPAHVAVTVVAASSPLRVGLASLVDVDTYLGPVPARGTARIDASRIGGNSFVERIPSLDPRLGGGRHPAGDRPGEAAGFGFRPA